ncbi:MAG: folate family ECF transporter S component [Clostridia bacterium]|nr:folate family ECF transporter S component [Clostridia bacterium]
MQKNKNRVLFGSLKIMMAVALLAGISIVCGKVLAIPGGDVMRFSFENLPILLAGMAFGPVVGCVTGVVADLLGCLMVGYTVNPLVTAGAAAIGLLGGLLFWLFKKAPCFLRVGLTVFLAHLVGSVVIKTFGLAQFYAIPFLTLMAWRGLNYLIVGALEFVLLFVLFRSKAFTDQLNKLKR